MLSPVLFTQYLIDRKITFFAGVPDSLLKQFCFYISSGENKNVTHITANSEGSAISLAIGHYLATGNPALVYMQNSGIGNALNPLISLADNDVYGIPMILLVGWRGKPNTDDEPQHVKQGKITKSLLETAGIKTYELIEDNVEEIIKNAVNYTIKNNQPVALIVSKNFFSEYNNIKAEEYKIRREEAIEILLKNITNNDRIVSTTGMISREIYEIREKYGQNHSYDFLCVGGMGHASQIAIAIAIEQPEKNVYCFDGDGAFLMQMGGVSQTALLQPKNFIHIVLNNSAHASVGGQATVGNIVDITKVAEGFFYKSILKIRTKEELLNISSKIKDIEKPAFIEVQVRKEARKDLGRPPRNMHKAKIEFMDNL